MSKYGLLMALQISSPTLLVDEEKCRNNIKRMVTKARKFNLSLKPHMKTHQSSDIAQWMKDEGIDKATVSSIKMAEYFARCGWKDITVAFPCNIREIDRINQVNELVTLSLLVNNKDTAIHLDRHLNEPVEVYIEIDTGSGRTGFGSGQTSEISQHIKLIEELDNLNFTGFYSHPGHSYSARSQDEIIEIHQDVLQQMEKLKTRFSSAEEAVKICIGDTPSCSRGKSFGGIDEISPGNFVFYDLMQTGIGSCSINDIAVAMACPVVEIYTGRKQIAVHGGAVHFSKETLASGKNVHFGLAVILENGYWSEPLPHCNLISVSQEHGILNVSNELLQMLSVGDLIGILPVHSCLAADLMSGYSTLKGKRLSHFRDRY